MFGIFKKKISDEQKSLIGFEVAILMRLWEEQYQQAITTEIIHSLAQKYLDHYKIEYTEKTLFEIGILALSTSTQLVDEVRKERGL